MSSITRAMRRITHILAIFLMLGIYGIPTAHAQQEFSLAISTAPTSLDPHFHAFIPNLNVLSHIFDPLVKMDPDGKPIPGLAESWKLIDNTTWEFKLRRGVRFHDGSELTADDVIWSLDRPATIVGSPGSFVVFTKAIASKTKVDPYTIHIATRGPYALLPNDLSTILIASKKAASGVKSEEFSTGKGLIGTGPFKFVRYQRYDGIALERNDSYWGGKPVWSKVTVRFISNDGARLTALLAGDVQAIEGIPTSDARNLRANGHFSLVSKVSHRLIFLFLDMRDRTIHVTDADGRALPKNPLKDLKVRAALSMAINRDLIKDQIMEGLSVPTNNLVPESFMGYNPAIKNVKYDPEEATKLLAQAGYPKGFSVKLHTPHNRYMNDEKIAQAIAQMWTKIGVYTVVDPQPASVFFSQSKRGVYSIGLTGFASVTGESSSILRATIACPDKDKGMGAFNDGRYCNPKVDEPLFKALNSMQLSTRGKFLQEAAAILADDVGVIPVHLQVSTWGVKNGIAFAPRSDERMMATDFRPRQ
jgi:peptide/nickel transport system substrate-binding protein